MKAFSRTNFTNAPEQIKISKLLNAPIQEVWKIIANHSGMTEWMPMIKRVDLVTPDDSGNWGEGSERHCQFGPDKLKESIVHWDPPYGYAYQIADMHLVKNHIGHFRLIEKMEGTQVTWTQYYHPNGNFIKRWMAKHVMLPYVMKKALKNLAEKVTL